MGLYYLFFSRNFLCQQDLLIMSHRQNIRALQIEKDQKWSTKGFGWAWPILFWAGWRWRATERQGMPWWGCGQAQSSFFMCMCQEEAYQAHLQALPDTMITSTSILLHKRFCFTLLQKISTHFFFVKKEDYNFEKK